MNSVVKFIFKWLFIVLGILACVILIMQGLSYIQRKYDLNLTPWIKSTVEVTPDSNKIAGQLNGDLTLEEITQQKNDVEAPTCDDVSTDFCFYDIGNNVVVFRKTLDEKGNRIYPNIVFRKKQIDTGVYLELDGIVNFTGKIDQNWFDGAWKFETLKLTYNLLTGESQNKVFSNDEDFQKAMLSMLYGDKSVFCQTLSYSNFDWRFVKAQGFAMFPYGHPNENEKTSLREIAKKFCNEKVVNKYFSNLGEDVEFIQADKFDAKRDDNTYRMISSYFTYLWRGLKFENVESTQKIIDSSDYFAKFIYDEDIFKNYPIPASKKAEYGDKEYYTVYNCKIYANCTYHKYDIDEKPVTKIVYPPIEPPVVSKEYSLVKFKLSSKDNSDLTNFDISAEPVEIKFNNGESLVFNNNISLSTGKSKIFKKNESLFYQIKSNSLNFDSYSGTFETKETEQTLTFDFSYTNGYVKVSVSLHNISAVDTSSIDLSKNPVKIVYNSKTGGAPQQFVFNKNEDLTKTKSALMKIGEYEYSVLSEQLIFSSTTGTQSISTTNREFLFTYSLAVYQDDLKFTVTVNEASLSGSYDLKIFAEESTTSLLGSKIGQTGYSVKVKIFDKDGYIVKTCDHKHGGNICTDKWSSNGTLIVGETYTGQLLYLNTNDNSKSYVTGTFTFEYKANTEFTFTYSCVEV